jgi:hypothetical protein
MMMHVSAKKMTTFFLSLSHNLQRNSADPFVSGGIRSSNSEGFLTRVADPPHNEDYGLANGLNELTNVVSFQNKQLQQR